MGRPWTSRARRLARTAAFGALFCGAACSSDADERATPSSDNLAVNEISAAGTEWLELYHWGGGPLDLAGYGLADSDDDTGLPRTDKALRFPADTQLASGAFLLVLLGKKDAAAGPYTSEACLPDVDSGCFYATFSISEARGEAVHLLTPDNEELLSVSFPANLAAPAESNTTVCRLPDGTGELAPCVPTPGASNRAE
jgi:hypothetical protein